MKTSTQNRTTATQQGTTGRPVAPCRDMSVDMK